MAIFQEFGFMRWGILLKRLSQHGKFTKEQSNVRT